MGVTNYLLKGIILQVGPRVFFRNMALLVSRPKNGSGGIFQEKNDMDVSSNVVGKQHRSNSVNSKVEL